MKVIFLDDVPNVGRAGDVREVKSGYARNFLLPKKLAVAATFEETKRIDSIRKVGLERQSKLRDGAQALVERLESINVVVKARCGPNGRLYGAVTNVIVAAELSKLMDRDFDRKDVILADSIRELGNFEAKVKVHPEITATINLLIEEIEGQD